MSVASIETTLELWVSSLRETKARIRPLFTQQRVAASAGQFLDGLLGPERRKTGWMRAEAAGDPGPWRQQAILGRGRWDADALRDMVRDYALETLADPDAVLGLDHNESRSWHGWHRHVSLVILAFAMLATIRCRANAPPPQKTLISLTRRRQTSSDGRSRKSAASQPALRSDASSQRMSLRSHSGDEHTKPPLCAHT